jgi:quinolinate synthase
MVSALTIAEQIVAIKARRQAVILAHHYQHPEIQELADSVGDALELAPAARLSGGAVIVFCGIRAMADPIKVLNPERM